MVEAGQSPMRAVLSYVEFLAILICLELLFTGQ